MKKIIIIAAILILLMGCEVKDGTPMEMTPIPTDYELNLYGENEGLYPDTNVLNNPENPFADSDVNMDNVWDMQDLCPSAKSKFYLWATLLARIPRGEHQYFTALSLHELYNEGGSLNAKEQAKQAYRAVLDHFYNSETWWLADWLQDETYYAMLLRDIVGARLYDPSDMGLLPLYNDPAMARADLGEWGYYYDIENKTISKIN